MKIDQTEIKIPLKKTVSTINGETEVSLSAMDKKETGLYKSYMSCCAMEDETFVNTAGMDKQSTMNTCANYYSKVEDVINEESSEGGLTPAQKKLPPALQQAILKKMGKEKPKDEEMEDSEAAGQKTKMLSKKDQVETCPTCEKMAGKKDMKNTCAECEK